MAFSSTSQETLVSLFFNDFRLVFFCLDLSLKQSCLVCLSAVLTVNAPLTEVVESMQEIRDFPVRSGLASGWSRPSVTTSEAFARSGKPAESLEETTLTRDLRFPWLICECFSILQKHHEEGNSPDSLSTLRSEVLLLLVVFVRSYFTLLRYRYY